MSREEKVHGMGEIVYHVGVAGILNGTTPLVRLKN